MCEFEFEFDVLLGFCFVETWKLLFSGWEGEGEGEGEVELRGEGWGRGGSRGGGLCFAIAYRSTKTRKLWRNGLGCVGISASLLRCLGSCAWVSYLSPILCH